jgi:glycine cleavage system transcriptional repressor
MDFQKIHSPYELFRLALTLRSSSKGNIIFLLFLMLHCNKNGTHSMQLTITALGNKPPHFIAEILTAISDCDCHILELRSSRLAQTTTAYLLVDGNWNHVAKLESVLDSLQKRLEIHIHTLRPETHHKEYKGIPYSLETISLDRNDVLENITLFLLERDIYIEEICASCYPATYAQTPVFSTRFILLLPTEIRLLSLREEFLDFCDTLNLDAILEPIKR